MKTETLQHNTKDVINDLWEAVSLIAANCDGAEAQDGVGFNGSDTKFGQRCADTLPENWTDAMASECYKMLKKYSNQLESLCFDYDDLSAPIEVFGADGRDDARQADYLRRDKSRIEFVNGEFHIYFKYSADLVSKVRNIMGSEWDGKNYRWVVEAGGAGLLRSFAEQNGFECTDEALQILMEHEAVVPEEVAKKRALYIEGRNLIFDFDYDADLVEAVKGLTGRRWDTKRKVWVVPMSSADTAVTLAAFHDVEISDDTREALSDHIEGSDRRGMQSEATDAEFDIPNLGGTLRPFQRAGVLYATNTRRCFIADQMGLGKTVQALASVLAENTFPTLVVCPASLKTNWEREARKWLPGKNVHIVDSKSGVKNADIVIINYDILTKHEDALIALGFQALVFDESHYAKNPTAKRTQALKNIASAIPVEGMVLALTGTPVLNRPVELVSQLEIIDRIDEFGGSWNFRKRYCNANKTRFGWDFSGSANSEELNDLLRRTCYVRRNKSEVLKELPDKARYQVNVDLNGPAMAAYRRAELDALSYFGGSGQDSANTLSNITTLKRLAGEGKIEAACEWIDTFLDSTDRKLVVFAHHVAVVDEIANRYGGLRVAGKDSAEARQEAVDSFQNDPDARVIVLNMKAGGVGLTLTAASDVLFVEQGWTPAEHDQAEDRCHRIGQDDNVSAWYLLADGTIDDDIYELIEAKRLIVDSVTDGEEPDSNTVLNDLVKRLIARTQ